MKQNWFGYVNKKDEVIVAVYSYWDMHNLKQMNYWVHIIEPFVADGYEEAKKIGEELRDEWQKEEIEKLEEI